jgi:hypothetical protein
MIHDFEYTTINDIQEPLKTRLPMFFPTSDCPETNRIQQLSFITYRLLPKGEEKSAW